MASALSVTNAVGTSSPTVYDVGPVTVIAGGVSAPPSVGGGVMALDAGKGPDEYGAQSDWRDVIPPITDAPTLGDGLRDARERSGRSLIELSSVTRVPVRYLSALEQNDFSVLPNRVFSIGYVRAYAAALGLDEQLAVERFTVPLSP